MQECPEKIKTLKCHIIYFYITCCGLSVQNIFNYVIQNRIRITNWEFLYSLSTSCIAFYFQ